MPPDELFGKPSQDIGAEYFADLFLIQESEPIVLIVSAATFDIVAVVPAQISGQTVGFDVPLAALGDDDGYVDVAMVLGNFFQPTDWAPDVGHGTIEPFSDAPWLSTEPESGEVAPGESAELTLTLGGPRLPPGTYEATLVLVANDPKNRSLTVDVRLEIPLAEGFGGIAGEISDAHTGEPLNATVTVHAEWQGAPLDVTVTASGGQYSLLAPAGTWQADFELDGYVGQTHEVEIEEGFTRTGVDAQLHRLQPHAEVDPGALWFELLPGQIGQQTVTLSNPEGHTALNFAIAESSFPVAVNAGSVQARPAEVTSHSAPAGHVNRAAPHDLDGSPVLVFMDVFPWDSDALLQVLGANGIEFDIAGSSEMGDIDLAGYRAVFISNDQPQSFYNRYKANADEFNAYVEDGGLLWFGAAAWGWADGDANGVELPGGATVRGPRYEDRNNVAQPDHALMLGVPNPFRGDAASHASFANLPEETSVIATGADSGQATLIEYDWGAGRVLGFGQTLEFAWAFGEDGGRILENGVPYAYSFIPLIDVPWLSASPGEGSVEPDESITIEVTVDASELEPGLYGARLVIQTNDPDNRRISVPILLTVPAYRQGINAGGGAYTTASGVEYAADKAFEAGSFGYVRGAAKQTRSAIAGTDDQPLYRTQREGMDSYRFSVAEGRYRVLLQFAEHKDLRPGRRTFTVGVEGQVGVRPDHDLVGSDDDALVGIEQPRQIVEVDEPGPAVLAGPAWDGEGAVVAAPDRQQPRCLVADVAVDIGVQHVLRRYVEEPGRVTELVEAAGAVQWEDGVGGAHGLEGGPRECHLVRRPGAARDQRAFGQVRGVRRHV
jgi:hypothetical protein